MIPPPPPLAALPLGTQLVAGRGISTVLADMDFETYSEAGLVWNAERQRWRGPPTAPASKRGIKVVGAARYAEHPTTEVLCLAYDLKDGRGRRQWVPGQPPPLDLFLYLRNGGLIEAWNAGFERHIWEHVCVPRMGWPPIARDQWRCAMAKARAFALPGSLADAAMVVGASARKDPAGTRLLDRFSVPRNLTKGDLSRRRDPRVDPEGPALYAYNLKDIEAEAEVSSLTPDLPPEELEWWRVDQEINTRGVQIDTESMRGAIQIVQDVLARANETLRALTGGTVGSVSEIAALSAWLGGMGVRMASLDEDAVTAALTRNDLPAPARTALQLRQQAGSASVKKLFAMENTICADGRLRDLFIYHGARTGRTTGGAVQPTNLPNHGPPVIRCVTCQRHYGVGAYRCPWCGTQGLESPTVEWGAGAAEDALEIARHGSVELIDAAFGSPLPVLAGSLRGLFVAAPGHDLIASDYSAIEAVVLAELAGEEWRREVFRTHGKIYEMSASKISGVPFEEMTEHKVRTGQHHPLRKTIGKVAELACFTSETQVLTDRGYVAIKDVRLADQLWDGVEWVSHQGAVKKGERPVIVLDGTGMTPSHPISTGSSWWEAKKLASSENMLSQALAFGSANLPSVDWIEGTKGGCAPSGFSVLAGRQTTPLDSLTWWPVKAPVAIPALRKSQLPAGTLSFTTATPRSSPTKNTAGGFLTDCRLPGAGVSDLPTRGITTTAAEGFEFTRSGLGTKGLSLRTQLRCRGGTSPTLKWTESTLTEVMNPGISDLFPNEPTDKTSEKFRKCSGESSISKVSCSSTSVVFDIVNAGPRHRFTIKTDSGHLIVHNSGYQGWIGAWKAFGADEFMTEGEMRDAILKWRADSPAIVEFWGGQTRNWRPELYGIEGCAVAAIQNPGVEFACRGIAFVLTGDALYCRLLSGRYLTYHRPRLTPSDRRQGEFSISYEGWNTNPKNGPTGWVRMDTWGGRLVENCTQATARDIQRHGLVAQYRAGYHPVLHVYDENVAEVPEGWGSVEEFERLMDAMPPWAAGWPVRAAGGWRGKRYRKD